MNVFYIDSDPYLAARWHGDKHVVKMVIETAQLLCTAHHVLSNEYGERGNPFCIKAIEKGLYKPTHVNHPCAKWVRECSANYDWAWRLFDGLCCEFRTRRAKQHATERLVKPLFDQPDGILCATEHTPPPLTMPDEFKTSDPVESYRQYYRHKAREGSVSYDWGRPAPAWLKPN